jgi:hypothetical protein
MDNDTWTIYGYKSHELCFQNVLNIIKKDAFLIKVF